VLLLDEPVAALDPLARRHFLGTLTEAVAAAEGNLTVILSSHLIADIERVCDHLILLASSQVQLCGDTDVLLAEHKVLVGPKKDTGPIERAHTVVHATTVGRQSTLLVRLNGPLIDPACQDEDVSLEELVLGYMGAAAPEAYAQLAAVKPTDIDPTGSHPLGAVMSCLQSAGFRQFVTYQPGWRYWPFQGIETGVYLLLSAGLLALTWYAIRHRDA
jgi:hypothetical protein